MNLFDFILRIKGFPIKEAMWHLQHLQSFSEIEMTHYIERQKQKIVNFHLNNNDFYKNFVGKMSETEWSSLPVLQKSDLQQPLKNRLSKGFAKRNVYINKTSGSGGQPFVFAKDNYTHALSWASIKANLQQHQIDLNNAFQARFYGIPLDFFGYYKERFKDKISSRYRFLIFDLSEQKMEAFLKKFASTNFDYINGYTSSIALFAKFLMSKNIVLTSVCPTLKKCIITAEMLFPKDKLLIEKWIGVPVVNEYGASELGIIAFTDINDRFVINGETLFVEILDDNNLPVPLGQSGRIVITSLYNKAHPFIRYDIGDIGSLSEKSTAQKPILKKLIGRSNDMAVLPSGKIIPGLTFYYITKTIIEDRGNVKEFVVAQTQKDAFEINYISKNKLSLMEESEIEKAFETYLESGLKITLQRVETLDRSRRGKLKQFSSNL